MSGALNHPGIIVGVDGSRTSDAAVDWAAHDASTRNVALTVVHVSPAVSVNWSLTPAPAQLATWQVAEAKQILADAVTIAEKATGTDGRLQIDTQSFVAVTVPTLVDLTKDAAMIVVGSRGSGAFGRALMGSVSSGLVRHAHCPVAVVHDEDPLKTPAVHSPVLVGIDGSPTSELATGIAFDEASRRGVDLVALHAWSDWGGYDVPGVDMSGLEQQAQEVLAERLAGWQERYPDVGVRRVVVCGQPARWLVEESEKAQLVVVGSHGRGGFAGMLLGSVGSAVLQSATTPVIIARQP